MKNLVANPNFSNFDAAHWIVNNGSDASIALADLTQVNSVSIPEKDGSSYHLHAEDITQLCDGNSYTTQQGNVWTPSGDGPVTPDNYVYVNDVTDFTIGQKLTILEGTGTGDHPYSPKLTHSIQGSILGVGTIPITSFDGVTGAQATDTYITITGAGSAGWSVTSAGTPPIYTITVGVNTTNGIQVGQWVQLIDLPTVTDNEFVLAPLGFVYVQSISSANSTVTLTYAADPNNPNPYTPLTPATAVASNNRGYILVPGDIITPYGIGIESDQPVITLLGQISNPPQTSGAAPTQITDLIPDFACGTGLTIPTWNSGTAYVAGDVVSDPAIPGTLYCIQANTGIEYNSISPAGTLYWDMLPSHTHMLTNVSGTFAPGQQVVQPPAAWVASTAYVTADVVAYPIPNWAGSTAYVVGNLVLENGVYYTCTTNNSDASFTSGHWNVYSPETELSNGFCFTCTTGNSDTSFISTHWTPLNTGSNISVPIGTIAYIPTTSVTLQPGGTQLITLTASPLTTFGTSTGISVCASTYTEGGGTVNLANPQANYLQGNTYEIGFVQTPYICVPTVLPGGIDNSQAPTYTWNLYASIYLSNCAGSPLARFGDVELASDSVTASIYGLVQAPVSPRGLNTWNITTNIPHGLASGQNVQLLNVMTAPTYGCTVGTVNVNHLGISDQILIAGGSGTSIPDGSLVFDSTLAIDAAIVAGSGSTQATLYVPSYTGITVGDTLAIGAPLSPTESFPVTYISDTEFSITTASNVVLSIGATASITSPDFIIDVDDTTPMVDIYNSEDTLYVTYGNEVWIVTSIAQINDPSNTTQFTVAWTGMYDYSVGGTAAYYANTSVPIQSSYVNGDDGDSIYLWDGAIQYGALALPDFDFTGPGVIVGRASTGDGISGITGYGPVISGMGIVSWDQGYRFVGTGTKGNFASFYPTAIGSWMGGFLAQKIVAGTKATKATKTTKATLGTPGTTKFTVATHSTLAKGSSPLGLFAPDFTLASSVDGTQQANGSSCLVVVGTGATQETVMLTPYTERVSGKTVEVTAHDSVNRIWTLAKGQSFQYDHKVGEPVVTPNITVAYGSPFTYSYSRGTPILGAADNAVITTGGFSTDAGLTTQRNGTKNPVTDRASLRFEAPWILAGNVGGQPDISTALSGQVESGSVAISITNDTDFGTPPSPLTSPSFLPPLVGYISGTQASGATSLSINAVMALPKTSPFYITVGADNLCISSATVLNGVTTLNLLSGTTPNTYQDLWPVYLDSLDTGSTYASLTVPYVYLSGQGPYSGTIVGNYMVLQGTILGLGTGSSEKIIANGVAYGTYVTAVDTTTAPGYTILTLSATVSSGLSSEESVLIAPTAVTGTITSGNEALSSMVSLASVAGLGVGAICYLQLLDTTNIYPVPLGIGPKYYHIIASVDTTNNAVTFAAPSALPTVDQNGNPILYYFEQCTVAASGAIWSYSTTGYSGGHGGVLTIPVADLTVDGVNGSTGIKLESGTVVSWSGTTVTGLLAGQVVPIGLTAPVTLNSGACIVESHNSAISNTVAGVFNGIDCFQCSYSGTTTAQTTSEAISSSIASGTTQTWTGNDTGDTGTLVYGAVVTSPSTTYTANVYGNPSDTITTASYIQQGTTSEGSLTTGLPADTTVVQASSTYAYLSNPTTIAAGAGTYFYISLGEPLLASTSSYLNTVENAASTSVQLPVGSILDGTEMASGTTVVGSSTGVAIIWPGSLQTTTSPGLTGLTLDGSLTSNSAVYALSTTPTPCIFEDGEILNILFGPYEEQCQINNGGNPLPMGSTLIPVCGVGSQQVPFTASWTEATAWNSAATYVPGNVVSNGGLTWVCTVQNFDITPSLTATCWDLTGSILAITSGTTAGIVQGQVVSSAGTGWPTGLVTVVDVTSTTITISQGVTASATAQAITIASAPFSPNYNYSVSQGVDGVYSAVGTIITPGLSNPLPVGEVLLLVAGENYQLLTVDDFTPAITTTIPVKSFTPDYAYDNNPAAVTYTGTVPSVGSQTINTIDINGSAAAAGTLTIGQALIDPSGNFFSGPTFVQSITISGGNISSITVDQPAASSGAITVSTAATALVEPYAMTLDPSSYSRTSAYQEIVYPVGSPTSNGDGTYSLILATPTQFAHDAGIGLVWYAMPNSYGVGDTTWRSDLQKWLMFDGTMWRSALVTTVYGNYTILGAATGGDKETFNLSDPVTSNAFPASSADIYAHAKSTQWNSHQGRDWATDPNSHPWTGDEFTTVQLDVTVTVPAGGQVSLRTLGLNITLEAEPIVAAIYFAPSDVLTFTASSVVATASSNTIGWVYDEMDGLPQTGWQVQIYDDDTYNAPDFDPTNLTDFVPTYKQSGNDDTADIQLVGNLGFVNGGTYWCMVRVAKDYANTSTQWWSDWNTAPFIAIVEQPQQPLMAVVSDPSDASNTIYLQATDSLLGTNNGAFTSGIGGWNPTIEDASSAESSVSLGLTGVGLSNALALTKGTTYTHIPVGGTGYIVAASPGAGGLSTATGTGKFRVGGNTAGTADAIGFPYGCQFWVTIVPSLTSGEAITGTGIPSTTIATNGIAHAPRGLYLTLNAAATATHTLSAPTTVVLGGVTYHATTVNGSYVIVLLGERVLVTNNVDGKSTGDTFNILTRAYKGSPAGPSTGWPVGSIVLFGLQQDVYAGSTGTLTVSEDYTALAQGTRQVPGARVRVMSTPVAATAAVAQYYDILNTYTVTKGTRNEKVADTVVVNDPNGDGFYAGQEVYVVYKHSVLAANANSATTPSTQKLRVEKVSTYGTNTLATDVWKDVAMLSHPVAATSHPMTSLSGLLDFGGADQGTVPAGEIMRLAYKTDAYLNITLTKTYTPGDGTVYFQPITHASAFGTPARANSAFYFPEQTVLQFSVSSGEAVSGQTEVTFTTPVNQGEYAGVNIIEGDEIQTLVSHPAVPATPGSPSVLLGYKPGPTVPQTYTYDATRQRQVQETFIISTLPTTDVPDQIVPTNVSFATATYAGTSGTPEVFSEIVVTTAATVAANQYVGYLIYMAGVPLGATVVANGASSAGAFTITTLSSLPSGQVYQVPVTAVDGSGNPTSYLTSSDLTLLRNDSITSAFVIPAGSLSVPVLPFTVDNALFTGTPVTIGYEPYLGDNCLLVRPTVGTSGSPTTAEISMRPANGWSGWGVPNSVAIHPGVTYGLAGFATVVDGTSTPTFTPAIDWYDDYDNLIGTSLPPTGGGITAVTLNTVGSVYGEGWTPNAVVGVAPSGVAIGAAATFTAAGGGLGATNGSWEFAGSLANGSSALKPGTILTVGSTGITCIVTVASVTTGGNTTVNVRFPNGNAPANGTVATLTYTATVAVGRFTWTGCQANDVYALCGVMVKALNIVVPETSPAPLVSTSDLPALPSALNHVAGQPISSFVLPPGTPTAGAASLYVFDPLNANGTYEIDPGAQSISLKTTLTASANIGALSVTVENVNGLACGSGITVGYRGGNSEQAVISSSWNGSTTLSLATPLNNNHSKGESVFASITALATEISQTQAAGTEVAVFNWSTDGFVNVSNDSYTAELWRSDDGGNTWNTVNTSIQMDASGYAVVRDFAGIPDNPTLYRAQCTYIPPSGAANAVAGIMSANLSFTNAVSDDWWISSTSNDNLRFPIAVQNGLQETQKHPVGLFYALSARLPYAIGGIVQGRDYTMDIMWTNNVLFPAFLAMLKLGETMILVNPVEKQRMYIFASADVALVHNAGGAGPYRKVTLTLVEVAPPGFSYTYGA